VNRNLQLGIHPDADKISVFVEGAATAREQEKMLAHLAECAECRKAVFLMQPQEEPQRVTATPEKEWIWRWLVPVGLPAAALACGLIAVFVYIRPHGASKTPQQMASVRPPETERPGTMAAPSINLEQGAPNTNADRAASINSEQVAQSGGRQRGLAAKAATNVSRQQSQIITGLNLPTLKNEQATANVAPQTTVAAPSASVQTADAALAQNAISSARISDLPLNGRNFTELQQLQADTKGAAAQNTLAGKKELPPLQIQGASAQNETLAGISGRITDRTGAVVAGVTVTLRDAAGKRRQTTTGTDGSFHLTQLPAGQYELTATASGFKTSQQSIELKPSELAMLQPVLDTGTASEVVEVEAASGAASVETESANVSGQVVADMNGVGRVSAVPSGLPVAPIVSHGRRFLSLDRAGNLFLSRNDGKKWKKIKPQWAGKAVRIELTPTFMSEASPKPKNETSGAASTGPVFLLTTDAGVVWSSKDGAHWHQQ
jgi:hypothetical protein